MTVLDERLRSLGDALDLETDDGVAAAVLRRLDGTPPHRDGRDRRWSRVAAALVLAVAVAAAAAPSSRRTLADWFGFDGVRIERRPDAPTVSTPDPFGSAEPTEANTVDDAAPSVPAIGSVVVVEGRDVLVSAFVGSLDTPAIGKVTGDGTDVRPVDVGGAFGLWIDGAPHDVAFYDEDGNLAFRRFAGNTLIWQDGRIIRRLEGFDDVARAIEYARDAGGGPVPSVP